MRWLTRLLLLLFVFAMPWEISLDLGEPYGNVARILGILTLLAAILATLQKGSLRASGPLQWMVLALYLWFCCSYFWTADQHATLERIRGYVQEMMIVWLLWEFADGPADLRALLRAYVAGCAVLAILTLSDLASAETIASGQFRFAGIGQDPNDVARSIDLGLPFAALLAICEPRRWRRWSALGYLPLGLVAVVATASRSGLLAAAAALLGTVWLLLRGRERTMLAAAFALPATAFALWLAVPAETFDRLATIPAQIGGGDLNQRVNIWSAGWHAFAQSPWMGSGAGAFVAAAGMDPQDSAHNTALSIAVSGGLCALFLAVFIVLLAAGSLLRTRGPVRVAFLSALAVWMLASLAATVEENRTTWLLLGMIALAGRMAREEPDRMNSCFTADAHGREPALATDPAI
jgi:O-antigen ligase